MNKCKTCTHGTNPENCEVFDCDNTASRYEEKVITIGAKIRESNESLAEAIESVMECENCYIHKLDGKFPIICQGDTAVKCKQRILDFLNQPTTDTEQHQIPVPHN